MDGTTLTPLQRLFLAFVAFFSVLFNRRFAEGVAQVRARTRGALPPSGPPAPSAPYPRGARPQRGEAEPKVDGSRADASEAAQEPLPATVSAPRVERERAAAAPAPARDRASGPVLARERSAGPTVHTRAARPPEHAEALHVLALLQRDGRLVDFLAEDLAGFSDAEIGAAARTVHAGCKKALDAYVELEPVLRDAEGATVTVDPGFDPAAVRLTGNVVGAPPFQGALRHHGWRATRAAFPPLPQQDPKIIAPAEVEL